MFEAEFKLTPNNINVFARKPNKSKQPVKQNNRFAYQGVDPIEFEDQYEALHFFFPFDFAYAEADSLGLEPVERHFYSNRGKDFLLAGVSWTWLEQAPAGKVIIDPTVSVDATEDIWLESAANKNNNVAGLLVGHAGGATTRKRTLVKFDLANAGIPANATILKAQLKMKYYSRAQLSGVWVDRDIRAHQLLVDWDEGEADTTFRLNGVPWSAPYGAINGTDAKATAESSVFFDVNTPFPSNQNWDLTALTRAWLDGSASNYGVILFADNENVVGYDLRFRSSDDGVNNNVDQPQLEIIWTQPVKTVYFLKDHLGSVRATVDDVGQVVGFDDYDPWGLILPNRSLATGLSNLDAAKNRFTGKDWDDEFGLDWNYFGARYYDPELGRFLSVDPRLDDFLSLSPYNYAFNNPIIVIDPDGRSGISVSVGGTFSFPRRGTGKSPGVLVTGNVSLAIDFNNLDVKLLATGGLGPGVTKSRKGLLGIFSGGFEAKAGGFKGSIQDLASPALTSTFFSAEGKRGLGISGNLSLPEDTNLFALMGGRIPDGTALELGVSAGAGTIAGVVREKTTILVDVKAEAKELLQKTVDFIQSFFSIDESEEEASSKN